MRIPHVRLGGASACVGLAVALALSSSAQARITKIVIDTKVSPAFSGQSFGNAGTYETIAGHAYGELDPNDPHNSIINDIEYAPLDSNGKVTYMTTFFIVKPVDLTKSSHFMWQDVPNRGGRLNIGGQTNGDIGLSVGWQGDNAGGTAQTPPPNNTNDYAVVPVATGPDGAAITGKVLARILNQSGPNSQPILVMSNPVPYRPVTLDTTQAVLETHTHESISGDVTVGSTIPSTDWAWASCSATNPFPGTPDPTQICLKNGFDPTLLYQVVFTARDPYILGIGMAAFRDMGAFLKHSALDDFGTPNPLAGAVSWSAVRGVSQSGNYTRAFIFYGMNEDESGRQVFDGAWPIIAGRRIGLNFRWALPDGVVELYSVGSEGPQWWSDWQDSARANPTSSLLDRCNISGTCPKIVETFGAAEVWDLKMSLEWVGSDGTTDIPLPSNVRRYYQPSTPHGGGSGGFSTTLGSVPNGNGLEWGKCTFTTNPVPETETTNAIRFAFRNWIMQGLAMPPSVWPHLSDGNLVDANQKAMGFPDLPGILPPGTPTGLINPVLRYDWGNTFNYQDATGYQSIVPPNVDQVMNMKVPRVDADGNEVGGVPIVLRDAPLGTYMGWNITSVGFHQGQICGYQGGMIPFANTQAQRLAANDPRLSLEERYGSHNAYVAAVQHAADNAVAAGYLLPADHDNLIAQAIAGNVCTYGAAQQSCDPAAKSAKLPGKPKVMQ